MSGHCANLHFSSCGMWECPTSFSLSQFYLLWKMSIISTHFWMLSILHVASCSLFLTPPPPHSETVLASQDCSSRQYLDMHSHMQTHRAEQPSGLWPIHATRWSDRSTAACWWAFMPQFTAMSKTSVDSCRRDVAYWLDTVRWPHSQPAGGPAPKALCSEGLRGTACDVDRETVQSLSRDTKNS